jgi:hypothetical protein
MLIFDDTDHLSGSFNFMDALRETCAENFTANSEQVEELDRIRTTAIANDSALFELIRLNPSQESSYRQQYNEAEQALEDRVMKMRLDWVTSCIPV